MPANNIYTDIFVRHGGKYTVYMAQSQVAHGAAAATARQLLDLHGQGMEIGSHSRRHQNPWGLTYWTHERSMPDTLAAAWDSLLYDASPAWMYEMADSIAGDLRRDPTFAKSFALPNSRWSPEVMLALEKLGYGAVRTGSTTGLYNRDFYYHVATQRAQCADTLMTGAPTQSMNKPRNMIGLPPFDWVPQIVGYKRNPALSSAALDSIRTNVHRAIFQLRGQDRRVLNLFWHDFKSGGYAEGVNPDELDAMLDVVDGLGGRYMTASEYTNWVESRATPWSTPLHATQADTFRVGADMRIWFRP